MQFKRNAEMNGTFLQGGVTAPYSKIVGVFGEPEAGDEYKCAFTWSMEFEDGTVATLYDWKETSLYNPDYPHPDTLKVRSAVDWHIGGHDKRAVERVLAALT